MTPIDWNHDDTKGLVNMSADQSLFVRAAGVRQPNTPAVVCIAGMADQSATWAAVCRHVSKFARIYSYDRAGLGQSELPTGFTMQDKAYRNMAVELKTMLDAASIPAPYVLVMHSMGALPGREFLNLYSDEVAGMVFVDTITEINYTTHPKPGFPGIMRTLFEGLDDSFLYTVYKPEMSEEELREALGTKESADQFDTAAKKEKAERDHQAIMAEVQNLVPSSDILAAKKQLETAAMGNKPVSVIKGDSPGEWQRNFELAVAAGRGTEEERKLIGDYLAKADQLHTWLQFRQLRLSENSRMVDAKRSWHNVHWYQPDLVAREVRWCLTEYQALSGLK